MFSDNSGAILKIFLLKIPENLFFNKDKQAILSKYGLATKPKKILVDNEKEEDKHTELITVISIIGAILIGLGIIVFVASNWQRIPAFLKLILLEYL